MRSSPLKTPVLFLINASTFIPQKTKKPIQQQQQKSKENKTKQEKPEQKKLQKLTIKQNKIHK